MPSIPAIRSLSMQDIKSFGNLSRTNLFQVTVGNVGISTVIGGYSFANHLSNIPAYNISDLSGTQDLMSIMCFEASLPTSSYATAEVKDNFIGVPQEFAHTRITTDIDFSFYVDRDYKVLMFFEAWMDYISGAGASQVQSNDSPTPGYYRRFQYPDSYKTDNLFIKKFEKDWASSNATNISYQFIGAFPKNMTSIPISYGESEILKVTVTMNYDRYVIRREYAPVVNTDGAGNVSAPGNEVSGFQGPPTPGTTTAQ